jgi:hypothetical protein
VRVHAKEISLCLAILQNVVVAVAKERPGHAGADHGGAQVLTVRFAQPDRAAVAVLALGSAVSLRRHLKKGERRRHRIDTVQKP